MKKLIVVLLSLICYISSASAQYALQAAFPNLPAFSGPTDLEFMPDGSNRGIVLEQRGRMWVFDNSPTVSTGRLFFDGRTVVTQNGCEAGLLGCAFHPDYNNNHFVYLSFDTGSDPQWYSRIVRYTVSSSNPDSVIPSSAFNIITFAQPFGRCNHKGGCIRFGPDGFLYAAFGDGGSGGDPDKNGQNRTNLLGKILRLDVDHQTDGNNYAIPADNPFATNTQGFKKEIYCYGMRNPWKFSFDKQSGKLWAGDVGQNAFEEIDTITNGGNYGWNVIEGFHCYPNGDFNCDSTGMIAPIWEYGHDCGDAAITGGYVYHGSLLPELHGKYIYAEYGSGRIWSLTYENRSKALNQLLANKGSQTINVSSFGEDANHELFFAGNNTGKIYQLKGSGPADPDPPFFADSVVADPLQKFINVSDNRTADQGMRSIGWSPIGPTDLSNFTISYDPQISLCNGDKSKHTVSIRAHDESVNGSIQLTFRDFFWNEIFDTVTILSSSTSPEPGSLLFSLEANRPNPFSIATTITYTISESGPVKLYLYDIIGREVEKIVDRVQQQGKHFLNLDCSKFPSGSYILRLEYNGRVISQKITKE